MPTKLNKRSFQQLIKGDLEWLSKQPRTLERQHIEDMLRDAPDRYYPSEPQEAQINRLTARTDDVADMIHREHKRATEKFCAWPDDPIHAATIVAEEAGELSRAALEYVYESGNMNDMEKEAVQTAVTAIRFLLSIGKYKPVMATQHAQEDVK